MLLRALGYILAGLVALAIGVVVPILLMVLAFAAGIVLVLDRIAPKSPQGTA